MSTQVVYINRDIVTIDDDVVNIVGISAQGIQGVDGPTGATGQGVPIGGTALQLLTKVDATNYNTQWASLVASQIPVLDAAKITTGTFDAARIPTLTLAKISDAGTMAAQNANAVAITGGTINGLTSLANNGNTTLGDAAGDVLTINGTAVTIPNGLNFDSDTLVIDATNNRVGVGASPVAFTNTDTKLHVRGAGATGTNRATLAIDNTNASGAALLLMRNAGGNEFGVQISGATYPVLGPSAFFYSIGVDLAFTANGDVDRGGARSIHFRTGYDAMGEALTIGGSGGTITTTYKDSATNNTVNALVVSRNSTNTPLANFASRLLWQLETSTTENVDAASIEVVTIVATHASHTKRVVFNVNDAGGAREYLRGEASGSAPMIGFLGAAAVIRQALGAWAGLTDAQRITALRDALTNLGLTSYT